MGDVRFVGYEFTQFAWSNLGGEDGDTVELVLSDVGNKWRAGRCDTVNSVERGVTGEEGAGIAQSV